MKRIIFIGVICLALSACTTAVPENDAPGSQSYTPITFTGQKATNAESRICESVGGVVKPAGRLGADHCVQNLPDAGKPCRDSDDCLSDCLVVGDADIGLQVMGQCRPTDNVFGCAARVEDGRAEPVLCID